MALCLTARATAAALRRPLANGARSVVPVLSAPAAASSACLSAAPAAAARALHCSAPLRALFGSSKPEESAASAEPAAAPRTMTEEEQAKENFRQYTKMMLRKFNLEEYESQLKKTAQDAPAAPNASLRERAATWLQRKTAEATQQEMPGAAVAKPQLKMLGELTAEEKAKPSLITAAVKERVATKTGLAASEVTLMLCRFDHLLATSEWFRWRRANGRPLPTNYMQMYDMMKEDRRSGSGMPRQDMNEMRLKPKIHKRR